MSNEALQLHEVAKAIGDLGMAVYWLIVVIMLSDFDGKAARAIDNLTNIIRFKH